MCGALRGLIEPTQDFFVIVKCFFGNFFGFLKVSTNVMKACRRGGALQGLIKPYSRSFAKNLGVFSQAFLDYFNFSPNVLKACWRVEFCED